MGSMKYQSGQWAGYLAALESLDRKDRVAYDATSADGLPARSGASARPDWEAVLGLARYAFVDIIPSPNGPNWHGDALLIGHCRTGDMGCLRFTVEMPDGERLDVAQDRIRPAK